GCAGVALAEATVIATCAPAGYEALPPETGDTGSRRTSPPPAQRRPEKNGEPAARALPWMKIENALVFIPFAESTSVSEATLALPAPEMPAPTPLVFMQPRPAPPLALLQTQFPTSAPGTQKTVPGAPPEAV